MKKAQYTILILAILALFACSTVGISPETGAKIAVSLAAKTLGQHMQGHFKWQPEFDAFISMVEADGISLNAGQMLTGYVLPKVPRLYQTEAKLLLQDVGFEFDGDALIGVARVDKGLLLAAVGAFKEGLMFK
jgi:hypothetical protein